MLIEVESGTYTGHTRKHNGYYAGDFSETPFQWSPLYPQGEATQFVAASNSRAAFTA